MVMIMIKLQNAVPLPWNIPRVHVTECDVCEKELYVTNDYIVFFKFVYHGNR